MYLHHRVCVCALANLLLPVEDSNDDEDEDTHPDQRDGGEQHAVAGRQVQFCAPAAKQSRGEKPGSPGGGGQVTTKAAVSPGSCGRLELLWGLGGSNTIPLSYDSTQ